MRSAFTLIELLVVVTIIAVLAGMLLPALGTVSAVAKSMRCRSNLRQLAIGAMAYAEDYEFYPPSARLYSSNAGNQYWIGWLSPYMEASKDESTSISKVSTKSVVWGCPAFRYTVWTPTSTGYGMNPTPAKPSTPTLTIVQNDDLPVNSSGNVYRLFRPGDVTRASARTMFADSSNWSLPATPPSSPRSERHHGQRSVLFYDGHVELRTYVAVKAGIDDP